MGFFILHVRKTRFFFKWIRGIKGCLESTSISILVNRSPTKEFTITKGLRQGDPLVPFLILIVVEGLLGLVRQEIHKNKLKGIRVKKNEVEVDIL